MQHDSTSGRESTPSEPGPAAHPAAAPDPDQLSAEEAARRELPTALVHATNMAPDVEPGDLVSIDEDGTDPEDGTMVVAHDLIRDDMVLGWLFRRDGAIHLLHARSRVTVRAADQVEIVGTVVEIHRKPRSKPYPQVVLVEQRRDG